MLKPVELYTQESRRRGESMSQNTGLIIVHTGNGKGKTTAALGLAMRAIGTGMKVVMVILDEVNIALDLGYLNLENVLETQSRPKQVHVVLTGRGAKAEIIEIADLVTEMREIKHPFSKGIKAQKGSSFEQYNSLFCGRRYGRDPELIFIG